MPKSKGKISLSSLGKPKKADTSKSLAAAKPTSSKTATPKRPPLMPGGVWLWCLIGLAVGLSVWFGGRAYLKRMLASELANASSEQAALQSIDALLRLDANATVEVSRGLAHPEFMVANAAFRALGSQLDAWSTLEAWDRLQRMQQVVAELERIPIDIDQDHRILVSGLASRIYADTLSSREDGASQVLSACRRVLAFTDPNQAIVRVARLQASSSANTSAALSPSRAQLAPVEESSPVPPPLPPLTPPEKSTESLPASSSPASSSPENDYLGHAPQRMNMPRMSLQDRDGTNSHSSGEATSVHPRIQLTAQPIPSTQPTKELSSAASSRTIAQPMPTGASDADSLELEEPTEAVVELSGLDQLSIDQLVRLLASVQPRVSQSAALTLRKRGMSELNLEMAMQLATGEPDVRQELLSQIARREDLDPRPWLLWMAAEGEASVRHYAVGLLSPMVDNDVRRQLRLLLNKERDEKVAQTIRQVLVR